MSLKCKIMSRVYKTETMKKPKSRSFSREIAIGTELIFFNEAGCTAHNSNDESLNKTGGDQTSIPHCSIHNRTFNTFSESCREDAASDSQSQLILQHSKRVLSTTTSSPGIKEGSAGDRLCPRIQRRVSQPPLATFQVEDYFIENLITYTARQVDYCPMCAKKTKWSFVAQINCTCMLKSNSELQDKQTQTENVNKLYDALLLFSETGDCIGTKLLQILTDNGYKICTLQRQNILGKYILGIYTDLILNSSYVIAVVSNELLQDHVTKHLLNRAFQELLCRNYNFLLPIVMNNCELPEEMKGYGSYKVSDNKNPNLEDIVERLLDCLPPKSD
ncbi:uncharacterized protein LOC117121858 [Anneissia japonica]|uniref:uncharacterized protein LOC117121858 n=1 Tax=Anneissia japonica TaxID=1529436 RepID=UPI001425587F|nr:uncharacterized protein LOC117121858 [Anneissia japonica]